MDILIDSCLAKGEAATMSNHWHEILVRRHGPWNRKVLMNDAAELVGKNLPRMSGMPIESLHARSPIDAKDFF